MTNIIKLSKKILIAILIIHIIFAIVNKSQALSLGNIIESGDEFLAIGKGEAEIKQNSSEIKNIISGIFSILFPLGVAITVIIGGVLGIKFMLASAENKAKIKEMLIPYTVGCILIFGATGIWNLVVNLGGEIVGVSEGIYNIEGEGFTSTQECSKATILISEGAIDITTMSDKKIKDLYNHNIISQDIRGNVGRPGYDYNLTDSQRIQKFISSRGEDDVKVKIYNEAKKRKLLQANGIDLMK